ncbi:MAG: hypothetical protein ABSD11_07510 [Methylocella sp.]
MSRRLANSHPNGGSIGRFDHRGRLSPFGFDDINRGMTTRMIIQAMRRRVTPAATKDASPEQTVDLHAGLEAGHDESLTIGRDLA